MKRKQPENKLVIKPILAKLDQYQLQNDVIWYCRLEAEDAPGIPAGTPDIVVIVNCLNGKIALLFIEAKKPGDKTPSYDLLRFEQRMFFQKMEVKPMTLCVVINHPRQLWAAIKKARGL